ncbi:MAG: hypothetical protein AMJ81_08120 [Phycisphaerae bacterium SM23_33]|nr:MAG: hypothetical protein AMJ81_08120 [Phycisphaerae bacterium SM23_33]
MKPWRALLLVCVAWGPAGLAEYQVTLPPPPAEKVRTVHTTDLYYAPWDWDDLNDATIWYALGGDFAELEAFVMDEPFQGWTGDIRSRGDGRTWQGIYDIAVGMDVPYYSGLPSMLGGLLDDGQGQPAFHHAGRDAILAVMAASPDHSVTLHAVGSPRDIAAAYNHDPVLFAQKVDRIYLSGGREGTVGSGDANWGSDPQATRRLLTSGLPLYIGLISQPDDSRHDRTGWSLDIPALLGVTDEVNPLLSQVVHWGYYCAMDGGYRMKHGIPFPDRPFLPEAIEPPDQFLGNNTMANPQAFFDEPTLPAIDAEIRTAGLTKAMWSPINFIDSVGLRIFRQGEQILLSYNDTEPGWSRVGFYVPVLGTVDGSGVFTYTEVPEEQANMHIFHWETATRGEYGDILNAVYRELVATYLAGPPGPGDADENGCVDGLDYNIWSGHYLECGHAAWSEGGWTVGNFNEDDCVDGLDYNIWSLNYLGGCEGAGAAIPEPASAALLGLGLAVVAWRRRRA